MLSSMAAGQPGRAARHTVEKARRVLEKGGPAALVVWGARWVYWTFRLYQLTIGLGRARLPDGQAPLEWAFNPAVFERELDDDVNETGGHGVRKAGNYYGLTGPFHPNYYHWLHDAILPLYFALDFLPADTLFVVPAT